MRKLPFQALLGVVPALLLLGACGSEMDGEEPVVGTETHALSGDPRHAVEYWRAYYATPASEHPARRFDRCTLRVDPASPHQILLGGAVVAGEPHVPPVEGRFTRYCPLDERPVLLPIATRELAFHRVPTSALPRPEWAFRQVERFVDGLADFDVRLDGRSIALPLVLRSGPQVFSYRPAPALPLLLTPRSMAIRPRLAVADGVFALLPTLPRGEHQLEVHVRMSDPPGETFALYAVRR